MDSSAPERERGGNRTGAPGREENKEGAPDQVQGLQGAPGRPLDILISSCPSLFPKIPAPGSPFITSRLEESANEVTQPPPEAQLTIN